MGRKFCNKTGAWLDGYLIEWCEHLKKAVANKWDGWALIDGVEGSGKSSVGMTMCYYVDRQFKLDNVVFTPSQFIHAVEGAKPGTAILWDEFVLGGLSEDAFSMMQRIIVKKSVTIRKKRLYVFLVIPYLFMLRPYFAVARTRFLVHASTPDGVSRGYFKVYGYERKKDLYFKGKKFYQYLVPPDKRGEFGNVFNWGIIDEAAYDAKKEEAIKSISMFDGRKQEGRYRQILRAVIKHLHTEAKMTTEEIAFITTLSQRSVQRIIKQDDDDTNLLDNPVKDSEGGGTLDGKK